MWWLFILVVGCGDSLEVGCGGSLGSRAVRAYWFEGCCNLLKVGCGTSLFCGKVIAYWLVGSLVCGRRQLITSI